MAEWTWDLKDLLVIGFVCWCAWSLAWSPDWRQGVIDLQHIALLAVAFLTLRRVSVPWWGWAAAALLALNPWLPYGGAFNENTQAEFLLVCLPFLLQPGTRGLVLWPVAVAAGAFLLGPSASHMGLVVLAAGIGAAALYPRRLAIIPVVIVLGAALLALGMIHSAEIRWSVLSRLQLFAGALEMWSHAPLWGHGLGSFDYLWPQFQNADAKMIEGYRYLGANDATVSPGTAHNEYLQVLGETGLIGLGLFLAAIVPGLRKSWPGTASVAFLALLCLLDSPLHDPQTAFMGAAALGTLSPVGWHPRSVPVWMKIPAFSVLCLALASVGLSLRHAEADVQFGLTGQLHKQAPQVAFGTALKAYQTFPLDKRYRIQLFRSLTEGILKGKIKTDWQTADSMYNLALTAMPDSPGLLISRLFLLKLADHCFAECGQIETDLQTYSYRFSEAQKVLSAIRAN